MLYMFRLAKEKNKKREEDKSKIVPMWLTVGQLFIT